MSNFVLSSFVRSETVATQRQHPLQEHLLLLSYSGKAWKSCWVTWRASTSVSSLISQYFKLLLIFSYNKQPERLNCTTVLKPG